MTDELSLSWTRRRAAEHQGRYQRVLAASLIAYAAASLAAILAPGALSDLIGLAAPTAWLRVWGTFLLITAILYVPGYLEPVRSRWCNVVGIGARFALALLYCILGGGFLWIGLVEVAFGLALAITYFNLFRSELMSRP